MAMAHGKLNIVAECRELRWGLWQCPPFLFLILGFITIISIVASAFLASRYFENPEEPTVIVVSLTTILFLVIGNLIINGFNKIAETNRMKSEFISIISHQLRSPLSIFRWTTDVLRRELQKIPEGEEAKRAEMTTSVKTFLDTLELTVENMVKLVNSLLESSRIEARTFILHEEKFSLSDLTQSVIDNFYKYAEASNITIVFTPDPALPHIRADRDRIAIIIQNLLDNAIRYTTEKRPVMIEIVREGRQLRWSIRDQGIGVPKSAGKHLFQKFFRAENTRNAPQTDSHGSGIGLYIAKEIAAASGGTMGFTSEEGRGSTFWFTLPIK